MHAEHVAQGGLRHHQGALDALNAHLGFPTLDGMVLLELVHRLLRMVALFHQIGRRLVVGRHLRGVRKQLVCRVGDGDEVVEDGLAAVEQRLIAAAFQKRRLHGAQPLLVDKEQPAQVLHDIRKGAVVPQQQHVGDAGRRHLAGLLPSKDDQGIHQGVLLQKGDGHLGAAAVEREPLDARTGECDAVPRTGLVAKGDQAGKAQGAVHRGGDGKAPAAVLLQHVHGHRHALPLPCPRL